MESSNIQQVDFYEELIRTKLFGEVIGNGEDPTKPLNAEGLKDQLKQIANEKVFSILDQNSFVTQIFSQWIAEKRRNAIT